MSNRLLPFRKLPAVPSGITPQLADYLNSLSKLLADDIRRTYAQVTTHDMRRDATELAGLSGATATWTAAIPAGSLFLGVTSRVTTLITGATSFKIGDGSDVDRWGATVAVAAGTTSGIPEFTITSPVYYAAATNIVLTANGSNFTAGAVRLAVYYTLLDPPVA